MKNEKEDQIKACFDKSRSNVVMLWLAVMAIQLVLLSHRCDREVADEHVLKENWEDIFLADPTILEHEGIYYLYGTDGDKSNWGFKVYRSMDLKDWEGPVGVHNGFALIKDEVFGNKGFWAPQVWHQDGTFYMAYTADENIAIATSVSPMGPFTQGNKVPIVSAGRQIDPFVFKDIDGKKYLYHVRLQEGNRIFVAELTSDYRGIDSATLKECIHASLPWENTREASWSVAEGPTVFRLGPTYYMLYSANDFRNPHYAVGVAVADDVYGPWKKVGDQSLLSVHNTSWAGTGHGDAFRVGDLWYYVCHTHFSAERVGPRRTAIVPFTMEEDPEGGEVPVFRGEEMEFLKVVGPHRSWTRRPATLDKKACYKQ